MKKGLIFSAKLWQQLINFGTVGGVCFAIDYFVGLLSLNAIILFFSKPYFEMASIIGSTIGVIVSVIVNYVFDFKFVFERKQNLDRKTEFIIFILLSKIGLFINSFIIWIAVESMYDRVSLLHNASLNMVYSCAKFMTTGIVMIYNFVIRKIF